MLSPDNPSPTTDIAASKDGKARGGYWVWSGGGADPVQPWKGGRCSFEKKFKENLQLWGLSWVTFRAQSYQSVPLGPPRKRHLQT